MKAIAAHFRYISKAGRLPLEDDRGAVREGEEALHSLAEKWQYGGSYIGKTSHRHEAFNILLSLPSCTEPKLLQRAAKGLAQPGHPRTARPPWSGPGGPATNACRFPSPRSASRG